MLRSTSHKFIFVHIPKNAGSSIANQLIPYSDFRPIKIITTPLRKLGFPINIGAEPLDAHCTASEIKNLFGDSYSNYFSFGFVRNPYDRLFSLYSYMRFSPVRNPEGYKLKGCNGINDYVKNYLGVRSFPKTQAQYLCDQNNLLIVSYVGRFETMPQSVAYLSKQLKLPVRLQHLNKSNQQPRSEILTLESIAKVNEYFKDDFDVFGYTLM